MNTRHIASNERGKVFAQLFDGAHRDLGHFEQLTRDFCEPCLNDLDCPPGEKCDDGTCNPSMACNSELGTVGCESWQSACCPAGKECCPEGKFCSATGEFLGISRAYRSVVADCTRGAKRRNSLAELDASIKSLQKSISDTCK